MKGISLSRDDSYTVFDKTEARKIFDEKKETIIKNYPQWMKNIVKNEISEWDIMYNTWNWDISMNFFNFKLTDKQLQKRYFLENLNYL